MKRGIQLSNKYYFKYNAVGAAVMFHIDEKDDALTAEEQALLTKANEQGIALMDTLAKLFETIAERTDA